MMTAVAIAPLFMFKSLPYDNDLKILIATGVSRKARARLT